MAKLPSKKEGDIIKKLKTFYQLSFIEFIRQFRITEYNEIYIPYEYFETSGNNSLEMLFVLNSICAETKMNRINYYPFLCYNKQEIILKGEVKNMFKCYFKLDYMEREKYVDFVFEINNTVPKNGMVNHYISNAPGHFASVLYIECDSKYKEQIEYVARKHNIETNFDKGLEEFMKEMVTRQWDCIQLLPSMEYEELKMIYLIPFQFSSNSELLKKGYSFQNKKYKPKLFISYCWKDQSFVKEMIEIFHNEGMDIWIDYQAIDYGDHILESIQNGINDCDIAVCFVSSNYKNSSMGKHELRTIWADTITKGKEWRIIKLDNVNPDEIYPGLGQFKYFDLMKEDKESFLKSINKSINKIKENK